MGSYPRRRRSKLYSRSGGSGSWTGYLRARKNSVIFFGLFLGGLLFSSLYAAKDSGGTQLILSMVTNHIQVQAASNYWRILLGCLGKNLGFVIFLYFAANCVQGRWLVNLVPVFFGLSVGSIVTALLYQHGMGAMPYLMLCVLVPKFLQLVLLMAVCNQAIRLSQELSGKNQAGDSCFLLFGVVFIGFSFLEALILSRFTGLLTYL